jgi:hypothetical protein
MSFEISSLQYLTVISIKMADRRICEAGDSISATNKYFSVPKWSVLLDIRK